MLGFMVPTFALSFLALGLKVLGFVVLNYFGLGLTWMLFGDLVSRLSNEPSYGLLWGLKWDTKWTY